MKAKERLTKVGDKIKGYFYSVAEDKFEPYYGTVNKIGGIFVDVTCEDNVVRRTVLALIKFKQ